MSSIATILLLVSTTDNHCPLTISDIGGAVGGSDEDSACLQGYCGR